MLKSPTTDSFPVKNLVIFVHFIDKKVQLVGYM